MTLPPVSRMPRPSTWFLWHGHRLGPGAAGARSGLRRRPPQPGRGGARRARSRGRPRRGAARRRARAGRGAGARRRLAGRRTSRGRGPSWAILMRFWCSIILTGQGCREIVASGRARRPADDGDVPRRPARARLGPDLGRSPAAPGRAGRAWSRRSTIVHGREVLEAVDAERWRAVASVVAVKEVSPSRFSHHRSNMHESRPGRRVAIVAGVRTPFAKSGTVLPGRHRRRPWPATPRASCCSGARSTGARSTR